MNTRMMQHAGLVVGGLLLAQIACAQEPKPDAQQLFARLIETRTMHDVGTANAVRLLREEFLRAGFRESDIQTGGPDAAHQNIVIRLPGKAKDRLPLLFIAHLDVVEAKREDWTYDPFVLTEHEGYFYGRGTEDIKNEVSDLAYTLIRLKQEQFVPARDIIVALTDGEEAGGSEFSGIDWLLKNHRDWINAEYVINPDGGSGELHEGQHAVMQIQTGEKLYRTYEIEASGKGGHSSLPPPDNVIAQLTQAVNRIHAFQFPLRFNETTRAYFERMSAMKNNPDAAAMQALLDNPASSAAQALLQQSPYYNALMRTTCVPTLISGGHAENALPARATAAIQCRTLPDDSKEGVQETLRQIINDAGVSIKLISEGEAAPISALNKQVLGTLESISKKMWPQVVVMPSMSTGASDGAILRAAGIPVYGVSGMFIDVNDDRAHGRDERIAIKVYDEGLQFMYQFMKALSTK